MQSDKFSHHFVSLFHLHLSYAHLALDILISQHPDPHLLRCKQCQLPYRVVKSVNLLGLPENEQLNSQQRQQGMEQRFLWGFSATYSRYYVFPYQVAFSLLPEAVLSAKIRPSRSLENEASLVIKMVKFTNHFVIALHAIILFQGKKTIWGFEGKHTHLILFVPP